MTGTLAPVSSVAVSRRCVRQAGALLDGKRVHVGAREHGLARAVSEDADDAGTADLLEDVVAELFELRRRERGGPGLAEAELGVCVEILVDAFLPERCRRETVQDVRDVRQWGSCPFLRIRRLLVGSGCSVAPLEVGGSSPG